MPKTGFRSLTVSGETYDMLEKERREWAADKGIDHKNVSFDMVQKDRLNREQLKKVAKVKA